MSMPAITVVNTQASAAANPLAGLTATGAANGAAATGTGMGLFMTLLNMGQTVSGSPQDNLAGATQFANKGFSMDPALLVLPQGMANLSDSELQSLLANASLSADGQLSNQVLISLTPGTPAADALADFLKQHGIDVSALMSAANADAITNANANADAASALVTSQTEANTNGKILLVATGLSPSDMDALKQALTDQANATATDQPATNLDGTDASTATAVALVMFIPVPLQNTPQPVSADLSDFDILSMSALNAGQNLLDISAPDDAALSGNQMAGQVAAAGTETHDVTGKYVSPFSDLLGDGTETALFTDDSNSVGFQGSLSQTSSHDKGGAGDVATTSLTGKLDGQSGLAGSATLSASAMLSNFKESSMMMTNGTALAPNQSAMTNPLITNTSAASAHPAAQTVAMVIEKAAANTDKAQQTLSVQLDPPELGRIQLQLSYEKGEPMKVHLLAEKQETLSLLQRDSHALKAALDSAGVQTDGSSLSFDLASGDQSFNQLLGGSQDNNGRNNGQNFSLSADGTTAISDSTSRIIETRMDFIPDAVTGNVHYSLLV